METKFSFVCTDLKPLKKPQIISLLLLVNLICFCVVLFWFFQKKGQISLVTTLTAARNATWAAPEKNKQWAMPHGNFSGVQGIPSACFPFLLFACIIVNGDDYACIYIIPGETNANR